MPGESGFMDPRLLVRSVVQSNPRGILLIRRYFATAQPTRPRRRRVIQTRHTRRRASVPSVPLPPGTPAPDFTLHSTPDQTLSLRDFRGQPVILAFCPADWSPVCSDQMGLYNEVLSEFRRYNAEL